MGEHLEPNLNNTKLLPRGFQRKYFYSQISSGEEHLKPNQITLNCIPEVFMGKYFFSKILSDGKSNSHMRKITVSYNNACFHQRLCGLHCTVLADHAVMFKDPRQTPPITVGACPPFSL